MATRVGLISDTHGLMRPEALRFLEGSDHILHAGDAGDAAVLDALGARAPVTAVRACRRQGGVLYVNPGSAGPRRFRLPVGVGELRIRGARVQARLVTLQAPPAQAARS